MRIDSLSLAPTVPAYNGATTHIVLDDFGLNLGRAYVETDEALADQKTIIENDRGAVLESSPRGRI